MITAKYNRTIPITAAIVGEGTELLHKMVARQSAIAEQDYLQRSSPSLYQKLTPGIVDITASDDELNVRINYPATIRFLDLKKAQSGKRKKYYTPIYNKLLFGHLYGNGYSLSGIVNAEMYHRYKNCTQKLREVMSQIEL